MSPIVKVFGCRPLTDDAAQQGRPASENLQGRKPREARRGRLVTHYGDLSAANAAGDRARDDSEASAGEDARLSERLVRRTVRAVVRFDRTTGHSVERRHCRRRTSEQSERICGIVARALS